MLIPTTKGLMDEAMLVKKTGGVDDENEHTTWVEYWLDGEPKPVHRSVHVTLKKNINAEPIVGGF